MKWNIFNKSEQEMKCVRCYKPVGDKPTEVRLSEHSFLLCEICGDVVEDMRSMIFGEDNDETEKE